MVNDLGCYNSHDSSRSMKESDRVSTLFRMA